MATQQPALHTVVVPPNAIPGTLTNFQIPDGSVIAVQLPPNAVPGSSITISAWAVHKGGPTSRQTMRSKSQCSGLYTNAVPEVFGTCTTSTSLQWGSCSGASP